jgi:hypothetical protein
MDGHVGQHGKVSIATNKKIPDKLAAAVLHQSENALTSCAL